MIRVFILLLLSLLFHPLHAEVLQTADKGYLESREGQLILHLEGSCYEMGCQHGKLLKELIQKNIDTYIDHPQQTHSDKAKNFFSRLYEIMPYVPSSFKEEMKGISDGSGISLDKIYTLNLFPELFHCTGLTAKNAATDDGSLYHVRVLDYAVGKQLQSTSVFIVAKPSLGIPFINVSYAGFIGCVTGMNAEKIAVGEIGGGGYGHWEGIPMSFLMRQILEKTTSVEEAKALLSKSKRTCEYYYIISDGKTNESVGVYATPSQVRFIEPSTSYVILSPKDFLNNDVLRTEDDKLVLSSNKTQITDCQHVFRQSDGSVLALLHKQPQDCLALTGFSYEERYPVLISRMLENYGQINVTSLMEIIKRPVARDSNLHNAIFHPATTELWVSQAGKNNEPACDQPYFHYSLEELLGNN